MPGPLAYSFVYAVELSDGVLLIDAGWGDPSNLAHLDESLRSFGAQLGDVRGVLCTHYHMDHYALAGRVREETGAWVALHGLEADLLADEAGPPPTLVWLDGWFAALGLPADERPELVEAVLRIRRARPRALPDRRLAGGTDFELDGCRLEVLHTPGHSPGHVCFVDRGRRVVFTGDHVLSQTTPNVSIFPDSRGSPLDDYLDSLRRVLSLGDLLALPGHEDRVPVGERATALLAHHEEQLGFARALVEAGHETVREVAERMPWQFPWAGLGVLDRHLALGETYAHLAVLERRGLIERTPADALRWRPPMPRR